MRPRLLCSCFIKDSAESLHDPPKPIPASDEPARVFAPQPAEILITMGPCRFMIGSVKCPCPGGTARSELGRDGLSLLCLTCNHPMTDHSNYENNTPSPTTQPLETSEELEFGGDICFREDTVSKLAEILAQWTVVHVRGTPSSGKTILAGLLARYYGNRGLPHVLLTGWRREDDPIEKCIKHYRSKYGGSFSRDDFLYSSKSPVFIIDEAQESYDDQIFWLAVLKTQSGRGVGPRFCLFSSYGSPSTGLSQLTMRSTPLRFGPAQRISLVPSQAQFSPGIGLFYTKNEFLEVVQKRITIPGRSEFSLDGDALEYIFSITNGHPAAVTGLLDYIYDAYRADIKHGLIKEFDKPHVLQVLDDDIRVLSFLDGLPVSRSFPHGDFLTVEAVETLRRTLANGNIPFDERDPGVKLCHQMGWLHTDAIDRTASESVCVFPSRIQEKFVEVNLASEYKRPFPIDQFPTLTILCERVLKNFSKSQLQHSSHGRISTSGKPSNPEAQFQDEFYRSFTALLGHGIGISSEWSKDNDGRIDFRVVDPGWGVELLRDGDRLAEHCGRFAPTGSYSNWIRGGQLKDWLILDCRHSEPKRTSQAEPKLWRVVFKDEYTRAVVLDCNNTTIIPEFPLLG
ncbi:hypothetical protein FQN50_000888 [Emmonsiellopsis sp. PD_5]|nr:hypothetical protein FQN50_000888 [Emmonsiellopsis sp. PD_5]